uniref:Uncharacterized protein n=1 Tax=Physcomitrium patens TaxID=3218 RepID=A0A2K1J2D3_PHYPA|nr:hypothetical protein PHYPA_021538 [Physcomitrium patens]
MRIRRTRSRCSNETRRRSRLRNRCVGGSLDASGIELLESSKEASCCAHLLLKAQFHRQTILWSVVVVVHVQLELRLEGSGLK